MLIKNLKECPEFAAGDKTQLRELLNPLKENLTLRYSLAHARVKPGQVTLRHRLKSSEVYYIIEGRGIMYIDNESQQVNEGQVVYIPPGSIQSLENTGESDLVFLCIVDPAWRPEDEEVLD